MERHGRDVVVLGSGGAGLVCALAARDAGARVTVLEKTPLVGGTTALSGGLLWIPNHPRAREAGLEDSEDEAFRYLERLAAGRSDAELVRAVVRSGPAMLRFLESAAGLAFETLDKPDYHPELPGARRRGRCLAPGVFASPRLGDWSRRVRSGPFFSLPLTWRELDAANAIFHPERLDRGLLERRAQQGFTGMGEALVGQLLLACLEGGVEIRLGARARRLLLEIQGDTAQVRGVAAECEEREELFETARGVVLACGGFEWSPELVRRFTAGPMTHPIGNPANEGDGLRMAMAAGADLANMSDLLRFPAAAIPGESYDGRPLHRMVAGERALPHSILVNRRGRRFVNEAHGYTDVARAFADFDPVAYEYANHPAFAIFDQQYRASYSVLGVPPGEPAPPWLMQAGTLRELARLAGIDADGLEESVARWNRGVAEGVDRDFRRGESFFDCYYADQGRAPSTTLGSVEKPPFFALSVHCGAIGSSGGPRTDVDGRVMHASGRPIAGLYACGDAAASAIGPGYGGPGGPLGQGFSMAWRAGRHVAGAKAR